MSGGNKFDQEKVRLELVPADAVFALGEILTFGAKKYAAWNWAQGMKWSRIFGALLRHLFAWARGEGQDPETGKSHLWHALCCIVFLVVYEMRGLGEDDRWKPEPHPHVEVVCWCGAPMHEGECTAYVLAHEGASPVRE